jgi:hypothetical protein
VSYSVRLKIAGLENSPIESSYHWHWKRISHCDMKWQSFAELLLMV